ncbi:MOSC domain-containing protein [Pseudotabrizicola sp. L79]|uniref:MOSC domain-containing protein n=1 Tax=Pseudotabrizicola sp. L79 TaxID=3118402 RepID=UPI002F959964
MIRLAHIVRHPIKSVGFEELAGASLTKGRALPFDREWAVTHEAAKFDRLTEWHPKMNFLRGVAGPELMAISAQLDSATRRVTLRHPFAGALTVAPDEEGPALVDWLRPLWPAERPAPARVDHLPGQAMTDWPDPFVSVLGLASNRALGQVMGQDLSIHRWRGNLWLDGLAAWAEFDLIGRHLQIGDAVLEVRQRITRCKATTVNPETGRSDADTLAALQQHFGHEDFGTYAVVVQSGAVALGDEVTVI